MALEAFVLLSVVSLIGVVAIPSYLSYRANSQANCIAQKFRTFASALHHYSDVHGEWPKDQGIGRIPPGLEVELQDFDDTTVIGGHWDWNFLEGAESPTICLVDPDVSDELLRRIDQILDDGNLTSGALVYSGKTLALVLDR